jgi:ribosomal protein S18 acetylase RimI-like enzyme
MYIKKECDYMWEVFDISFDEIEIIKDLWEKNRKYHEDTSEYFGYLYSSINFYDRIKAFAGFSKEMIKITVAKDEDGYIGYCISTIIDGKGELESIHVSKTKRGNGIGHELARIHLDWMRENKCKTIGVTVSQENKETISFYKKLGFYSNTLYMQQLI